MQEMPQCIAEPFCRLLSVDHRNLHPAEFTDGETRRERTSERIDLSLVKPDRIATSSDKVDLLPILPFAPVQAFRCSLRLWWSPQPCWQPPRMQRATESLVAETCLHSTNLSCTGKYGLLRSFTKTNNYATWNNSWHKFLHCETSRGWEEQR